MTYIISELHGQYGGSIEIAEAMILQSKMGGANAVKVQLYDSNWQPVRMNQTLGRDYLSLTKDELARLKEFAERLNIDFFASVFDEERLSWVLDLKLPKIKIANGVFTNKREVCDKAVATGKPVIISLTKEQLTEALPYNESHVSYLYTIRKYPALLEDVDMPQFSKTGLVGYSDHAPGISACMYALMCDATILEKHFTVSRTWQKTGELAHLCSMDLAELQQLRAFNRDLALLKHDGPIKAFE